MESLKKIALPSGIAYGGTLAGAILLDGIAFSIFGPIHPVTTGVVGPFGLVAEILGWMGSYSFFFKKYGRFYDNLDMTKPQDGKKALHRGSVKTLREAVGLRLLCEASGVELAEIKAKAQETRKKFENLESAGIELTDDQRQNFFKAEGVSEVDPLLQTGYDLIVRINEALDLGIGSGLDPTGSVARDICNRLKVKRVVKPHIVPPKLTAA